MLLIPTIVKDSSIHGLGVFAAREIHKGERVWKFDHRCDFRRDDFPEWLGKFVFRDYEGVALDGDNARFINHSDCPNLIPFGNELVAADLISTGIEMTVDYNHPSSLCGLNTSPEASLPLLRRSVSALYGDDIFEVIERVKDHHHDVSTAIAESIARHGSKLQGGKGSCI